MTQRGSNQLGNANAERGVSYESSGSVAREEAVEVGSGACPEGRRGLSTFDDYYYRTWLKTRYLTLDTCSKIEMLEQ